MATLNGINEYIVKAEDAYLYQLFYNKIDGGKNGCNIVLNGVNVNVGSASTFNLSVLSVSGGTGCYLSGYRPNVLGDLSQYKYVPQTFVSVWDTTKISTGSSTVKQIKLPLISTGTYNFIVDWGDGTSDKITSWNQAQTTHTYSNAGVYKLIITGTLKGFRFANSGDRLKLLSIFKWGVGFSLGNTDQHFYGCSNLELSEIDDVLVLKDVTSLASSFRACGRLAVIDKINSWDTSNITNFSLTFYDSIRFNSDISNWDTSNVVDMQFMFASSLIPSTIGVFNQNIGNWNTSKVTNMRAMFANQTKFNQDISTKLVTVNNKTYIAWDTSKVNNISSMFYLSNNKVGVFNQNIGNWNTSNVNNMQFTFANQPYFNQDISTKVVTISGNPYIAWSTSNVLDMSSMFSLNSNNNTNFNQNIGNWDTSKVTNMQFMFYNQTKFNQDISTKVVTISGNPYIAWSTSNVSTMRAMFYSIDGNIGNFNQNIGNWNISKVTTTRSMFYNQPYFNQDISTKSITISGNTYFAWDTSNVVDMQFMFYSPKSNVVNNQFNQNIGNWNTIKVTGMTIMFHNTVNFNQNIGNWNVSQVTVFNDLNSNLGFADGIGLSISNYDSLLIGWASRPVKPNIAINFGTIKHSSSAVAAKLTLTSPPNNWTIIDGGLI